jgi:hypothetical protein
MAVRESATECAAAPLLMANPAGPCHTSAGSGEALLLTPWPGAGD